jgi:acetyl-CoA C-acetyltransferase
MKAFIIQVARTVIAPKGGVLKHHPPHALAASAIRAVLTHGGLRSAQVNEVILGNALGAGGNIARVAALAALSEQVPAVTIDTQCCSGMDAIAFAADRIRTGQASVIVAGGVESFSQAPLRAWLLSDMHGTDDAAGIPAADIHSTGTLSKGTESAGTQSADAQAPDTLSRLHLNELLYQSRRYRVFTQASFTPWADRDPAMLDSALAFAARWRVSRSRQEAFAIESHRRALQSHVHDPHLHHLYSQGSHVDDSHVQELYSHDPYSRRLTPQICARLPPLGHVLPHQMPYAITAATMAVEADAAAVVLVVNESIARYFPGAVEVLAHASVGADPMLPAGAGTLAARRVLASLGLRNTAQIRCAEIMASFAAQTLVTVDQLGLDPARVNRTGGLLARGHPIGASGAILVGNLFLELQQQARGKGALGLAAIPAAGGLGSAMVLRR